MKILKDEELDVVEIVFKESGNVYGSEEESGVVLFRDTVTDELCSVELLFYSKYPDVWSISLELLGLGYLKQYLREV